MLGITEAQYTQREISESELKRMPVHEPGVYKHPESGAEMVCMNVVEATEADRMGMKKFRELQENDVKGGGVSHNQRLIDAEISVIKAKAEKMIAEVMESGLSEDRALEATESITSEANKAIGNVKRKQ